MSAFAIGSLVGRLLVSYLLVWIVCVVLSRFNVRAATHRSIQWYSLVAVLLLFVLGVGVGGIKAGVST